MNIKTCIYLIALASFGCTGHDKPVDVRPKLAMAIWKYAAANVNEGTLVDSVAVLDVDTLTERNKVMFKISKLTNESVRLGEVGKLLNSEFDLLAQKAILDKELFGRDNAITKIAFEDAQKKRAESEDNVKKMKILIAEMDSLNKLVNAGTFDSVAFCGYHPKFIVRLLDSKSGSVKWTDTLLVMVDGNFHIIEN